MILKGMSYMNLKGIHVILKGMRSYEFLKGIHMLLNGVRLYEIKRDPYDFKRDEFM